jgi:hypothetical protein
VREASLCLSTRGSRLLGAAKPCGSSCLHHAAAEDPRVNLTPGNVLVVQPNSALRQDRALLLQLAT